MIQGLCTGHENPDLWFSDTSDDYNCGRQPRAITKMILENTIQALAICNECPMIEACKAEGMRPENIENGIWGGTLAGERILLSGKANRSSIRTRKIKFAEKVRATISV